ncbi:MAG: methyltransferase domain-containing protein [Candidatus Omnitrophota bacterium]|jgi:ubiquinone/menaquinone biosynthesis C-methylase UbiE
MTGVFDKYYKKYDAWYERNKFVYLSEIEALKKALPKKGKGLEIGVGTGRFASILGIEYGVDPSKNMLQIARRRGIDACLGTGEKLPFENFTFDYIAVIITFCFVKDPVKVLAEAKRVLKENGKLIIGIIDKDSFLGKFYRKKKSIFYQQAHFFGVKEVVVLLRQAGFKKFSYFQTLFSLPEEISYIEKPQKGFDKGGFVVVRAVF